MKIPKYFFSPIFLLISITLLGLILRSINLWDNVLFGYDQARDAQRIYEIIKYKDIKIVGPETDIPGVFNGPLLYYLLLPIYWLSNFDPNFAALFFIFINLSGVWLLFKICKIIFKNNYIGLLAAFLWSISTAQGNFARYISNASLMSITTLIFFLGLAMWLFNKKGFGLIVSAIGLGLSIHLNFYLVYLIIFYPLLYFLYQRKFDKKTLIKSGLIFLLIILPLVIAELKWRFQMINTMLNYFNHHSLPLMVIDRFGEYIQKITSISYHSFFSFNYFFAFLFLIYVFYLSYKNLQKTKFKFLALWTVSTLPLFAFQSGVHTVEVINSSIYPAITILTAFSIYTLFIKKQSKNIAIILLIIIIASNLSLMTKGRFMFTNFFEQEYPVYLKNYKNLVDYTYQEAKGKEFSICSISVPLFFNTKYSFFYSRYGQQKYGYLPFWSGQEQFLNQSYIPYATKITKLRYIIIEPPVGMPQFTSNVTLHLEDQVSQLIEVKQFGHITIQKREYINNPNQIKPSLKLSKAEITNLKHIISVDPRYSCFVIHPETVNENNK